MYFCCRCGGLEVFQNHLWFHTKEEFMWGLPSYIVSPQVVGKLCDRKDFAPACWLTGSPWAQILFEPRIHVFCLSVGTWMEGG